MCPRLLRPDPPTPLAVEFGTDSRTHSLEHGGQQGGEQGAEGTALGRKVPAGAEWRRIFSSVHRACRPALCFEGSSYRVAPSEPWSPNVKETFSPSPPASRTLSSSIGTSGSAMKT